MYYGTMTPRILAVCAEVSDQKGIFLAADVRREMRRQYPQFFSLYSAPGKTLEHVIYDGKYVKRVRKGVYRVPHRVLDKVIQFVRT